MNKTPYQFRYYGDGNENNYPSTLSKNQLIALDIFNEYNKHSITQIGIQGTPGIQFKLNNSKNWIEIGKTGIYELDLTGIGHIESILFNNNWAMDYRNPETKEFFLFIDIIYEDYNTSNTIEGEEFYEDNSDYDLIISSGNANGEEAME